MVWDKLIRALGGAAAADPAPRGLAVAVLLLETARADFEHAEQELQAARHILAEMFSLDQTALDRLMTQAEAEARLAVSLHGFVTELNRTLDGAAKTGLIGSLWRVAHADGQVHPQEEHLIRRLADLLHVPHHEFVRQRLATTDTP
ncbi:MAG TPA: TerB family tellurite resistance protein [Solimonas sp.]|nr:TerB family tellurite resistance protein [Solimonas sp.]